MSAGEPGAACNRLRVHLRCSWSDRAREALSVGSSACCCPVCGSRKPRRPCRVETVVRARRAFKRVLALVSAELAFVRALVVPERDPTSDGHSPHPFFELSRAL